MKQRIVLVNPRIQNLRYRAGEDNAWPLNILSIGSLLQANGFSVSVLDGHLWDDESARLKNLLNPAPVFVGFSVMTPQIGNAISLSTFVRQQNPEIPIVWGGIHPSLDPLSVLNSNLVDYVTIGTGYHSTLPLARKLSGEKIDLSGIPGLGFKNHGVSAVTKDDIRAIDWEQIPNIDYNLCENQEIYHHRALDWSNYSPKNYRVSYSLQSGVGCPHRCSFCVNPILNGQQYSCKSAERVISECLQYVRDFGANHIFFRDDNFFGHQKRFFEFLDLYLKLNCSFSWDANCRVDYFKETFLSEEIVARMKQTNCLALAFGVESGSPRILKLLKKDINVDLVFKAVELTKKYGIISAYSFMKDLPGETWRDKWLTKKLINQISQRAGVHWIIGPQSYRPYPGSMLYKIAMDQWGINEPTSIFEWQALMESPFWMEKPRSFVEKGLHFLDRIRCRALGVANRLF